MKPPPFTHHAPTTLEQAVTVLGEVGHDGKVLAGGQSLIPILSMRLATPAHLVDINRVAGLDTVEVVAGAAEPAGVQPGHRAVRVGALVRHARLERDAPAEAANPLLGQALRHVAHPAIRNRGTTVGAIAHADPSGEIPAVLALTGGEVEAHSVRGTRRIAAADFFLGPLETALAPDELAVAVRFDALPDGAGTAFDEIARRSGDYALAGLAAVVTVSGGVVRTARVSPVSLTAVPTVIDLDDVLAGAAVEAADWAAAADAVRDRVDPEPDIHATAEYRRALAAALAARLLPRAAAAATDATTREGR